MHEHSIHHSCAAAISEAVFWERNGLDGCCLFWPSFIRQYKLGPLQQLWVCPPAACVRDTRIQSCYTDSIR